jgi:hypothetical protein
LLVGRTVASYRALSGSCADAIADGCNFQMPHRPESLIVSGVFDQGKTPSADMPRVSTLGRVMRRPWGGAYT